MIDLTPRAGLPIRLDSETGDLVFGDTVAVEGTGERLVGELRDVLAEPDAITVPDDVAYLLYRGVHDPDHSALLAEHGLRYDLTVIMPGEVGEELIKTAGHIHSLAPDGVAYPEIYDVLHGVAAFILQFADPLRVVIVVCEAGERILIPPGASHLTVNVDRDPLVVADLVAIDSQNDYGEFRTRRGAAVHLIRDDAAWTERVNPAYDTTPTWQVMDGSRIGDFGPGHGPLYPQAISNIEDYRYLTAPAPRSAEMRALWTERTT